MFTTSIVNQKGGTGKTTTTINLGCALAEMGKRILLVDFDPQANLTFSFGIDPDSPSVVDILWSEKTPDEVVVEREGLHILPSAVNLADFELSVLDHSRRIEFLRGVLDGCPDYDFIFIDCPPSLSVLTLNALYASDEVLIPLQMEVLTLQGLAQLLDTIESFNINFHKDLHIGGILAIKWDSRRKLSSEIHRTIGENVNAPFYSVVIRENVRIAEAPSFARSVLKYAPSSNGARDYRSLAKEYLERHGG